MRSECGALRRGRVRVYLCEKEHNVSDSACVRACVDSGLGVNRGARLRAAIVYSVLL